MNDLDRSLNARAVAEFEGRSIVSINRDIRAGRFPVPDYTIGQNRYWKLSTVIRHRERRIADSATKTGAQRARQLAAVERARKLHLKRAELAANETLNANKEIT